MLLNIYLAGVPLYFVLSFVLRLRMDTTRDRFWGPFLGALWDASSWPVQLLVGVPLGFIQTWRGGLK